MKLDVATSALSFVLAISALQGVFMKENEAVVVNYTGAHTERAAITSPQGPVVNGISLQGPVLQGTKFNGVTLVGGAEMQDLELRGGELMTTLERGRILGGEDLEGLMLEARISETDTVALHLDDVTPTTDFEIFEYTVSYWNGRAWSNLCGEQNGVPVRALALAGRWDESSGTETGGDYINDSEVFTFACKNAVLAKCVVMGYAPWRSVTECNGDHCQTIEMRDMHQACTRMMRADYCGDGTPHTQNGTTINVWDNVGMQTVDVNLPVQWTDEAEWTPNGATSIQQVRWSGTAETYIDAHCPERWSTQAAPGFATNSTFFTTYGFETPVEERNLLRNQFTHDAY